MSDEPSSVLKSLDFGMSKVGPDCRVLSQILGSVEWVHYGPFSVEDELSCANNFISFQAEVDSLVLGSRNC